MLVPEQRGTGVGLEAEAWAACQASHWYLYGLWVPQLGTSGI